MESEQETQIRNLKYRVEDLESDLRDLKEKLKEEVWYRKAQDLRLEGETEKPKRESQMGPEEKAKVWKEFMSSLLAQEVYTTYYHGKYHGDEEEEDLKNLSIESIVHTSEMMNLLVHGYEARTLAEKPKEESQMGPTWLDEPNHPKDGSGKWYWVQLDPLDKPGVYLVYWTTSHEWVLRVPGQGQFSLRGKKVAPIQEPS